MDMFPALLAFSGADPVTSATKIPPQKVQKCGALMLFAMLPSTLSYLVVYQS